MSQYQYLQTALDTRVLDLKDRNGGPGTQVVVNPIGYPISDSQLWMITNDGYIVNKRTGYVLDVQHNDPSNGATVTVYPKNSSRTANQLWTFTEQGWIRSQMNNYVLNVQGGAVGSGVPVTNYAPVIPPTARQVWLPVADVSAMGIDRSVRAAKLCQLAYQDEATVRRTLPELGYDLISYYDITAQDVQGFLAHAMYTPGLVVVFRGTDSWWDLGYDLFAKQVVFGLTQDPDVKVLWGFDIQYSKIAPLVWDDMVTYFTSNKVSPKDLRFIDVMGHSLGAAISVYSTLYLASAMEVAYQWSARNLFNFTFGCPPVGNSGFQSYWYKRLGKGEFSTEQWEDPGDPVAQGDVNSWGISQSLSERYDYFKVGPLYCLPISDAKGLDCHYIQNYIDKLEGIEAEETHEQVIEQLTVYITTGKDTVSPWYSTDGPGTNRDITFTIGTPKKQQVTWPLDNAGDDFESGKTDVFLLEDPTALTLPDLTQFTINIDVTAWTPFGSDNWDLDGVKIVANGVTIYERTNLNKLMGPDYTWSFTDNIKPRAAVAASAPEPSADPRDPAPQTAG